MSRLDMVRVAVTEVGGRLGIALCEPTRPDRSRDFRECAHEIVAAVARWQRQHGNGATRVDLGDQIVEVIVRPVPMPVVAGENAGVAVPSS